MSSGSLLEIEIVVPARTDVPGVTTSVAVPGVAGACVVAVVPVADPCRTGPTFAGCGFGALQAVKQRASPAITTTPYAFSASTSSIR